MSEIKQNLKNKLSEKLTNISHPTFAKALKQLVDEGIVGSKIDEFGRRVYFIKDEKKADEFLAEEQAEAKP